MAKAGPGTGSSESPQESPLPLGFRRLVGLLQVSLGHVPPAMFDPDGRNDGAETQEELARFATVHGVVPWLVSRIEAPERYLAPALIERWRVQNRETRLRALFNLMWVVRLVRALGDAGIAALPIKGIAVAARYYGDFALRPPGDVDVMITLKDRERAQKVLLEIGLVQVYPLRSLNSAEARWIDQRMHHYLFRDPRSSLLVELHWALHDNSLMSREDREFPSRATETIRLGSATIPALDRVTDYLLLLTHTARSAWRRLKWILDIELAWRALSPVQRAGVNEEILRLGLGPTQVMHQRLAATLIGGQPEPLGSSLPAELTFLVDLNNSLSLRLKLLEHRNLYRLRTGAAYRWDTLKYRSIVPEDVDMLRLPAVAFPLYVPLRLPVLLYRILIGSLGGRPRDH